MIDPAFFLTRRGFLLTLAIVAVWRIVWLPLRELAPDEAVYWVWSRNLSLSYFDHPPMVAWMIRAGTLIFGETELGVRIVGVLLALATPVVIAAAGRWVSPDPRVGYGAAMLWLVSPLSAISGTIMTPDTPLLFFGACAVALALAIFSEAIDGAAPPRRWLWVPFGVVLGLAFLSKYTAVLLVPPFGVLLVATARGRRELLTPWPWMGVAAAMAVFSPVLAWNVQHDWASFGFQLNQGLGEAEKPEILANLAELIGGQIIAWTPFYWLLTAPMLALVMCRWKSTASGVRMAVALGGFHLAFFLFSAARKKVEMNWPILAYQPLALATVWWVLMEGAPARRLRLATWAVAIVAFFSVLVCFTPELARLAGVKGKKLYEVVGWRSLSAGIAPHIAPGTTLVARDARTASILAFYLPGQPRVWIVRKTPETNSFTFFDPPPDLSTLQRAVFFNPSMSTVTNSFPVYTEIEIAGEWRGKIVRTMKVVAAERHGQAANDRERQGKRETAGKAE